MRQYEECGMSPVFQTHKPIEAYLFIDPLCKDCRTIDPFVIRLLHEYGHYFSLRHVLTGTTEKSVQKKQRSPRFMWEKKTNTCFFSCSTTPETESPFLTSLAIKAAELQGKKAGLKFLRKLQETLLVSNMKKPDNTALLSCAYESKIDAEEFKEDLHAASARKAFQRDLKFTNEMQITEVPSLIFFHTNADEEGLKIAGIYSYEVYVQVLAEIVNEPLVAQQLPPLEHLLAQYDFFSTTDVAIIYGLSYSEAERELKKLLLKQVVQQIPTNKEVYWQYKKKDLA